MFVNEATECNFEAARAGLSDLEKYVAGSARNGTAAHDVERNLYRRLLDLGTQLFGSFLRLTGPGDLGPTVTLKDGELVNRLPEQQSRRLVTVFGEFTMPRFVYGTRPGQKIELAPTDVRLQLPESDVSYLLQKWDQRLGVEHAFATVAGTLGDMIGLKQPVDTLERGSRQMAESAPAFRASQPAPDPEAEGEILVVTEDNKGVPMVRPVKKEPAGAETSKQVKANKKQMACIGCVYTVNPHFRTSEELIAALFRDPGPRRKDQPHALQKRYWAELTHESAKGEVRAQKEVFTHLAKEVTLRRKPGQQLVHLSDGQHSLETDRDEHLPRDEHTVDILDLLHVTPRLWDVAHLFHGKASDAARQFVRERLPFVLAGNTAHVIAEFRQMGIARDLRGAQAKRMATVCSFLENNLHRMKYDEYLKAGYPVATGVIEGACRHVIKDRMERTGMRWKIPGARAMLQLRTIVANGDWEEFQKFRIQREGMRLYPHKTDVETIPWPIAA